MKEIIREIKEKYKEINEKWNISVKNSNWEEERYLKGMMDAFCFCLNKLKEKKDEVKE